MNALPIDQWPGAAWDAYLTALSGQTLASGATRMVTVLAVVWLAMVLTWRDVRP